MNMAETVTEQAAQTDVNTNIGSLVNIVNSLLEEAGHPNPKAWQKYLHTDAFVTGDLGVQRFLVNRCFRLILGNVSSENTMDARYCLVDTGEIKDWARLFKTGVVPTLVRLNLPE